MSTEVTLAFFSGNDVLLKVTVTDADNPPAAKDLTGATEIVFAISKGQGKVATKEWKLTDIVPPIVITDAAAGKFEVTLAKADTEPLGTKHVYHETRITDATGNVHTVMYGTATISPNTITV